jgi:hypothetical protein
MRLSRLALAFALMGLSTIPVARAQQSQICLNSPCAQADQDPESEPALLGEQNSNEVEPGLPSDLDNTLGSDQKGIGSNGSQNPYGASQPPP